MRTDIQALRAFAVLAVVLYHVWPGALPGGFVGVDVFFVISGYLITRQLVRSRFSDRGLHVGRFWAARARRLLPASLTVLAVSAILTILFAPELLQTQYLRSIIASALYVENWQLAFDAVDYLGADNAPPIAQHYWSLSVEEQFYVLWPLLLLLATIRRPASLAAARTWLLVGCGVLVLASFALSVVDTLSGSPFAYFSTIGRIWEFGLGALVALSPLWRMPAAVRAVLWWTSLLALIATVFLFSATTPFPGPSAALPVIATAVLIGIGPGAPARVLERTLALRPVQWVGNESYGIYLWHWPLIIIAPAILGRPTDLWENIALVVATFVLAALTRRFIEDPIRFGPRARAARPLRVALFSGAAMAVVVVLAVAPIGISSYRAAERADAAATQLVDPAGCRGASALLDEACAPTLDTPVAAADVLPAIGAVLDDTGGAFACYDAEPTTDLAVCTIGSDDPDALRIALTGDSHAAMLIPGLAEVAAARGWAIDTYVGRGCVWMHLEDDAECGPRRDAVEERLLSGDYDAILTTARNAEDYGSRGREAISTAMADAWRTAKDAGITVMALADNPLVPQESLDCLSTQDEFDAATCAFPADSDLIAADPVRTAAADADVALIDLGGAFCTDDGCPMVAGGVVVYRDTHHITATFSRTFAPFLADEMETVLAATR